ncbi:MAG: hypothetical protein IKV90_07385 [Clostridia bacterium]|nr:hypothetical protein [Clostridia bacterium]
MILDDGICTVYAQTDVSGPGGLPRWDPDTVRTESYYKELNFETSPQWPTEHRPENKVAGRVRILQCRGIQQNDVAKLLSFSDASGEGRMYRISRAYHGTDDDSGERISDLTLEVMEP